MILNQFKEFLKSAKEHSKLNGRVYFDIKEDGVDKLINKSKNKLSTSHNLICNMRGMGGTDKSVLKKILGVED